MFNLNFHWVVVVYLNSLGEQNILSLLLLVPNRQFSINTILAGVNQPISSHVLCQYEEISEEITWSENAL